MQKEFLYYRYVKTCSLFRLLEHIQEKDIMKLSFMRQISKTEDKNPYSNISYIRILDYITRKLQVDYCSLFNGQFNRQAVIGALIDEKNNYLDASVSTLHIIVPGSIRLGERMANMTGEKSYRNKEWVAILKSRPVQREHEENEYTRKIRDFRTKTEIRQGFDPASLDLQFAICLPQWKIMIKSPSNTKKYKEAVNKWTQIMRNNREIPKMIVDSIFPEEYVSGRIYQKGIRRGEWILKEAGNKI